MRIAIDPGHGLGNTTPNVFDPGAVKKIGAQTFAEADIVLRYGHTLKQLFEDAGHEVFMTRTSSADPAPVSRRATNARDADCDAFVSLHLNSAASPQARGLEVLFRDADKDKPLADRLLHELVQATGLRDRGTKRRTDLAVLKFNRGPAVLIELGFISNDGDRDFVISGANRDAICQSIVGVVANGN